MNFSFSLRWLASLLIISVIALSSGYWLNMSSDHDQLRAYTIDQAGKRASQLAELQAHHMEALFLGIDLALRQFRDAQQSGNNSGAEAISRLSQSSFPKGSMTGFLASDVNGYITYFNIVNATQEGNAAYHSTTSSTSYYVKDRDYFKFHSKSNKDQLFIGKPIQGRTSGNWNVPITRAIF